MRGDQKSTLALVLAASLVLAWAETRVPGQQTKTSLTDAVVGDAFPAPVIRTHELMELFSQPIHAALREDLNEQPRGPDAWKRIEQEAYRAAEVANLIAIRRKSNEDPHWSHHAQQVQQAAIGLAQAAKDQEYSSARESFVGLVQSCNQCHQMSSDRAPNLQPFNAQ